MPKNNLQSLNIGTWVFVDAVSSMEYHDNKRVLMRRQCVGFKAQIVGIATRYMGRYRAGSKGSIFDYDDFEEASLVIEDSVRLWWVRTGLMNSPILVHDEDLIPTNGGPSVMRQLGKINYPEPAPT